MAVTKSKQELALNRLAKKLTSLRATLRKDERDLLDQVVLSATFTLGEEAEVAGHAALSAGATAATFKGATLGVVDGVYAVTFK